MARFAVPPLTPNHTSKHQTPASLRIDLHYARLNLIRRWNWERFHRLAAFLNVTYGELASLIALPHSQLYTCRERNYFHGSAALLLTLLEANALKDYSEDVIAQPFPTNYAPPKDSGEVRADPAPTP